MSFEDFMMKRLAKCHAEACDEILKSVRAGRSLSDAVTDAIEALPASKTRDLRRWLEDWEPWEEWQAYEKKGWRVRSLGKGILALVTPPIPPGTKWGDVVRGKPAERLIAAAAGVRQVKDPNGAWERFDGKGGLDQWDRVYEVVRG